MQCTHFLFQTAPLMCVMCAPQIEFAQHQSRLAKMDTAYEKCTGMKKIDWTDNLKGKLESWVHTHTWLLCIQILLIQWQCWFCEISTSIHSYILRIFFQKHLLGTFLRFQNGTGLPGLCRMTPAMSIIKTSWSVHSYWCLHRRWVYCALGLYNLLLLIAMPLLASEKIQFLFWKKNKTCM